MTFPYNTTLPNPPDDPADDVGGMQVNTLSIAQLINVDHVGFNSAAGTTNGGFHNQVRFQIAQPAPNFAPGVATLAATLAGGQAWPFWRNSAPNGPFQMMGNASFPLTNNGYITTAFGLIIQWGNFNPNSSINVTFPITFNNVFNVQMTQTISNNSTFRQASISTGTLTTSGFTYEGSVDSHINPIYWLAIGN